MASKRLQTYFSLVDQMGAGFRLYRKSTTPSGRVKSLLEGLDNSLSVTPAVIRYGDHDRSFLLDSVLRDEYETVFGFDLSGVKLHTGHYADELAHGANAFAVTVGSDIYFADGHYAPDTEAGKALLAHELTHAVQNLKGNRFVFVEDIAEAEYEGNQAEALVNGIGLHAVRQGEIQTGEGARIGDLAGGEAVGSFQAGIGGSGPPGRESLSLGDFSASGQGNLVHYTTRSGKTVILGPQEYQRAKDDIQDWIDNEVDEVRRSGDDRAYEEKVLRVIQFLSGRP